MKFILLSVALAASASFAEPKLLFHAAFDGSAQATAADGVRQPRTAQGLAFVPGRIGEAVRMTRATRSVLAYDAAGAFDALQGTVTLWAKSEWPDDGNSGVFRFLFSHPRPRGLRCGTGALSFWWYGSQLRGDVSDDADSYVTCGAAWAHDGGWHHLAFSWNAAEMIMYVDGRRVGAMGDGSSPLQRALQGGGSGNYAFSRRLTFDRFFVGGRDGAEAFDGCLDDLRIYSEPLTVAQIGDLVRKGGGPTKAACGAADPVDHCYCAPSAARPGTFAADDLALVDTVTFAQPADLEKLRKANRFMSVGTPVFGRLGDTGYVEPGAERHDRFAVRFTPDDPNAPLYVIDIDYPDDKKRTADVVVQACARQSGGDNTLQCGFAAGAEYANTGRILTHRLIWWARPGGFAVILMNAREKSPAAVSAIRLYRVKSGKLPVAAIRDAPANADGWRRSIALYYEDPAIGSNFSVPGGTETPQSLSDTIDRTIATMRFTGENLFAYPGAWYQGLICESYDPRPHAPDFLSYWYSKFDHEGDLYVVPTLNVNNMPVPRGLVTLETMTNGALHSTPIAIHNTGRPNWGGWHGSPPNFNVAHPEVQAYVRGLVDTLIAQGKDHPSFKGIALHVPWHCLLSFGTIKSGYNDYCIEAFERDRKVKVRGGGGKNPLRGKAYYEKIVRDPELYAKWIDWRCDVVTAFWADLANRLRAARPDLKLWINAFTLSNPNHPDWAKPDYVRQVDLEAGIDGAKLTAAAKNLILSQCIYPADPRWRGEGAFRGDRARWEKQLDYHAQQATYQLLDGADFPWVGQHDRYWESAIGTGKKHWSSGEAGKTLTCSWLEEMGWRVTTVNPSGYHALRHFVLPLRFHDVLGMSKGGFLIGTYGMEPYLAAFAQAFRALPAVKMDEFFRAGDVVARQAPFGGRIYGYVVNTEAAPVRVKVPVPAGATDAVTGRPFESDLALAPYELRSFVSAPAPERERFADSVAFDTALSWVSSPGRFTCPPAYGNDSYRYVADLVASTGVTRVRERLRWAEVSPDAKTWKPGRYRANADLLAARGIAISGMFHDAPASARGPKDKLPRDLVATFDFCRRAAEEFGSRMDIWEYWNEQDIGFTNESAWDYVSTFKAAALGFRAGGFKGLVAPGALCRHVRGTYDETYFANDVMAYSDIMNFHTYMPPHDYPSIFAALRGMMSRYGAGDKAIFLSECGTNQEGDSDRAGAMKAYMAHSPDQEAIQEEFVVKSQILSRMEGILRNYFFIFGAYNERNGMKDWGVIRRDGTCKPAVAAFRSLIAEVGAGALAGEVAVPERRVRAFRFDMPDGSRRLAYWRRSEIDDGTKPIEKWEDAGVSCDLPLAGGGTLPLAAHRRVAYVTLPKGSDVSLMRTPRAIGTLGWAPAADFDPSVVLQLEPPKGGARLGADKSLLEIDGDSISLRFKVWNLDTAPKTGALAFAGTGSLEGLPAAFTLAPRQATALELVYRIRATDQKPKIVLNGRFDGKRISPLVVPVLSDAAYRGWCREVLLGCTDVTRWHRNTSANRYDCAWDEREQAVRFHIGWDLDAPGVKDRWFFPRYALGLPKEDCSRARMLVYEVKSAQDKVENDYRSARTYLVDGKGKMKDYLMPPPTANWELRRLEITPAMCANGLSALQFGGHPCGRDVTYWIRNVRVYCAP